MKIIILAAGEGSRLRPLTNHVPKCMVEVDGKPIINHQIDCFQDLGLSDIIIVRGYLSQAHQRADVRYYTNDRFAETNMVYSLFCAEDEFNDDIIISYGDIIFQRHIIKSLLNDNSPVSVTVDKDWFRLWKARMPDPLVDAETLKLDGTSNIVELGKKPNDLTDIEGQFMGLIKIKKDALLEIRDLYHSLDEDAIYDGKSFETMYMTSFLQLIIDQGINIRAIPIYGGWIEIDIASDISLYRQFLT